MSARYIYISYVCKFFSLFSLLFRCYLTSCHECKRTHTNVVDIDGASCTLPDKNRPIVRRMIYIVRMA